MVKLMGRSYSLVQFFHYSSFSLYFAFCVFLNLFPSLCFPYALSISPLGFSLFSFSFPVCCHSSSRLPLLLFSLFSLFSSLFPPLFSFSAVSFFPSFPPSVFLFSVVQCWCGCDGEWQWLLDEEDDELTMALAVLVRLSPLLYSFLCRSPLVFPLVSSFVFFFQFSSVLPPLCPSVSPAFIGQRPCAGNGQLDNVCRGMTAVTYAP